MPADQSPRVVLSALASLSRGDDLARLVHTVAFAAADERRTSLSDGLAEATDRLSITHADAETPYGNVVRALERGGAEAAGSATRSLLAALLARGVALAPPADSAAEARVAEALVWIATHTSIDALAALDAALGTSANGLWVAVANLIRRVDGGTAPLVGRAGALIAAAALAEVHSAVTMAEAAALSTDLRDPLLRSLLTEKRDPGAPVAVVTSSAAGEVVAPPRGPVSLVLLGFTGILAVLHAARLVGRLALRYRRPAEVRISARGITVLSRTELLGRTLRERETHFPVDAVARASREVRYPRAALYAGLIALAVGSYVGISCFIDGARAGSPELLAIGVVLVVVGIALDYMLENVAATAEGKCRIVIVPRKGSAMAIGAVDPGLADLALGRLLGARPLQP